ncbi:MAG: dienelactone hydrolase family protein [Pseudomonadota bacterium]
MCHGEASSAFPEPGAFRTSSTAPVAAIFGNESAAQRIAILPDIYGANPFYQGLATRFADQGAAVHLIDTFAGLGDLPKATREAAFARRHKLKDRAFVDHLEEYLTSAAITGVVGFCLGGLFVFDLARRRLNASLVAFYPFPQGLPNQDALDIPFDYLDETQTDHTVLVGDQDASLGSDLLARLADVAGRNPSIDLHVFERSEHGFLADLDSDDEQKRLNAIRALEICETRLAL